MNTARRFLAGAGTQTAALGFGGYQPSPYTNLSETEEYDGNSWTVSNPLNTARQVLGGCGTQTAGLAFGGYIGPLSSPGNQLKNMTDQIGQLLLEV
jgi:hypothetical protein